MIKRFFNWLMNWPDCSHSHKDPLHQKAEMTEYQLFEAWAFGWPAPEAMHQKMDAWNERHSDLLILKTTGVPGEDLKKMHLLYIEHKEMTRKR